jgi:hypothetical protein
VAAIHTDGGGRFKVGTDFQLRQGYFFKKIELIRGRMRQDLSLFLSFEFIDPSKGKEKIFIFFVGGIEFVGIL